LSRHNINPRGNVHRNPHIDWLTDKSLDKKEVVKTKTGALLVYTGKYTGRSPKDKFIVDTPSIHDKINWNTTNVAMTEENFEKLYQKVSSHLSNQDDLYIFDGFAGADKKYKLHVRVVSEYAYQTLFSIHLLRRPTAAELLTHMPQLTVLSAPNCFADPKTDGTTSETFIVLNMEKKIVLIGGTKYSGEIKKSIFSVMNILLPEKNVLPMHCSANVGHDGKTALFFGLSGTGKTTLSADPNRQLIGDDEHGWSENGIFNFEGGCYAKCINLKKESEPQIWGAIRHQSLLENVVIKPDGEIDFTDPHYTENTRVVYPIEFIENAILSGIGGHPSYVIFLTADAFGVLPPVAKLSIHAAMYHFMSGYTSKLAGTERGITEPKVTFSPFFGGPFMALKPLVYANLLRDYIKKYKTKIYLVNTGWSGGVYGVGKRISIHATRAIITAILEGKLDETTYHHDDVFNLDVPKEVPLVNSQILKPRQLWRDKKEYDTVAGSLVTAFQDNFKKFKNIPDTIINAGPNL
jgi:phosphoenolpyruvate carboxykinase (ATP)